MVTLFEAPTTAYSSYQAKLRQFGAMLDIHRTHQGVPEILMVTDRSKAEASAGGTARFTKAGEERWSVMAGGRDAAFESPIDTLNREVTEEFDEIAEGHLDEPLPAEIVTAVQSAVMLPESHVSLYPFIVGQLKFDDEQPTKLVKINEVAASTVVVEFDQLPSELRNAFSYLEKNRVAKWVGVERLVEAFHLTQVLQDSRVDQQPVRPQFLTMAAIHAMQFVNNFSEEAIEQLVLKWNKQRAGQLHRLAKKHQMIVNNGVFTQRGTIYQNLSTEDRQYLGVK